jgi:hypothetical protein
MTDSERDRLDDVNARPSPRPGLRLKLSGAKERDDAGE